MTALLLSIAVYGQGFQVVDSTFTQTKLDQDSLYYDEMAYLDDYHFHDNIFVLGQLGISHSMSENTRFGNFFDNAFYAHSVASHHRHESPFIDAFVVELTLNDK